MNDPYMYEGTEVLKNKLGIRDAQQLKEAEGSISFAKLLTVDRDVDSSKFDINYIKNIHKYIFGDIYEWAGEFRTVTSYKEERVLDGLSVKYALPKNIEQEAKECLKKLNETNWESMPLNEKSLEFTKQIASLWQVHPFKEGNTRTTLTFAFNFSEAHKFPMHKGLILKNCDYVRDGFVMSSIGEYSEYKYLQKIIEDSIILEANRREHKKGDSKISNENNNKKEDVKKEDIEKENTEIEDEEK